ncbi:hypothetical protein DFH08DRAFT_966533 [Mycena albidolilacea]|uniref:Uncharacterized protein n=1 Tax=Mycena albidolilacea TaxID=1033008 RepID=A0AAD6ZP67_9AGAR|nr:hypothetical protein DFH08DRAFT_966533 [Mycena albidolilacea]
MPSTRVYHRGTQADRLRRRATKYGRLGILMDAPGRGGEMSRCASFTQTSSTFCPRPALVAAAHAAPALVTSPRLASPRPRPAPPIHLLCTAPSPWPSSSPCGRPSSINHLICAFVRLECVVTVRAARGQASTQHAYGPLATVPHSERRTRATTPSDGTPRVESFYEPTGLRCTLTHPLACFLPLRNFLVPANSYVSGACVTPCDVGAPFLGVHAAFVYNGVKQGPRRRPDPRVHALPPRRRKCGADYYTPQWVLHTPRAEYERSQPRRD